MSATHFLDLAKVLTENGFPTVGKKPEAITPFEQLIAMLSKDSEGRQRIAQIQHIPATNGAPADHEIISHYLQLCIPLPFLAAKNHAGEVTRLLCALNKTLEMPGFGFSEVDGLIYYQFVLPCFGTLPKAGFVEGLLGLAEMYLDNFSAVIEDVATGKKSCDATLQEYAT